MTSSELLNDTVYTSECLKRTRYHCMILLTVCLSHALPSKAAARSTTMTIRHRIDDAAHGALSRGINELRSSFIGTCK